MSTFDKKGCDQVLLRAIAQISRSGHSLRILFKDTHNLNSTVHDVVNSIHSQLDFREHWIKSDDYRKPIVTIISCGQSISRTTKAISHSESLNLSLLELIPKDDPSKELSMIVDYGEVNGSEETWQLALFIHYISTKATDEATTPPLDVLRVVVAIVVAIVDAILPDAHGRNEHFVDDMKRLVNMIGDNLSLILPSLLRSLIRISEDAGSDAHVLHVRRERRARKSAGDLLVFLLSEHTRLIAPYIIHLETLVMRLLTHTDEPSCARTASLLLPRLLQVMKNQGGLRAMRQLWSAFWTGLRVEMDYFSSTEWEWNAVHYIKSINECIVMFPEEAKNLEVGGIVETLLNYLATVDEKDKIISREKSLFEVSSELFQAVNKSFGSHSHIASLYLPRFISIIEKFEWGNSIIEILWKDFSELNDIRRSSKSTKSEFHSLEMPLASVGEPNLIGLTQLSDYETFRKLRHDSTSGHGLSEQNKMQLDKIPSSLNALFLWKMINSEDETDKMIQTDLMSDLSNLFSRNSHVEKFWLELGSDLIKTLCDRLLKMLLTDCCTKRTTEKLIDLVTTVAGHRLDRGADTQNWTELIDFILDESYKGNDHRLLILFEIISQFPKILGKESPKIIPLFVYGLNHSQLNIRLVALSTFHRRITAYDEDLPLFYASLMQCFIEMVVCEKDPEEVKAALKSLEFCSRQTIEFLRPHLIPLFDLCVKSITHSLKDNRSYSMMILRRLTCLNWHEVIAIIGLKRIDELCDSLFKAAHSEFECEYSLYQVISSVAKWRFDAHNKWSELILFIEEACEGDDFDLKEATLSVMNIAPSVLIGEGEKVASHVKRIILECVDIVAYRYDAIEALVSVAVKSEKEGDEGLIQVCSEMIPIVIEKAKCAMEEGRIDEDMNGDDEYKLLRTMMNSKLLLPHLSSILTICKHAMVHKKMRVFATTAAREIRHQMNKLNGLQSVNLFSSRRSDKSALILSSLLDEGNCNEVDVECNEDDEIFGKVRLQAKPEEKNPQ